MQHSKFYLISPSSPMYSVVAGYIVSRDRAYTSARSYLRTLGEFKTIRTGVDGFVSFVDFAVTPEGWSCDKRGMSYPVSHTGSRQALRDVTLPVPNQVSLVRAHTRAPLQIEYREPGYSEVQSENIGKLDAPCGFQWVDKQDGPFAFWIPNITKYVIEAERRGCRVLPFYRDWELRLRGVVEISQSEWAALSVDKRLGKLYGNQSMAR